MKQLLTSIVCIAIGSLASLAVRTGAHDVPPEPPHVTPVVPPPVVAICPVTNAPCICGCASGTGCICGFPSWKIASKDCWDSRKNAVVFVGVRPRNIAGAVCCRDDSFCDDKRCVSGCIVVGVWRGAYFERHDLPATATDAQIRAKLAPATPAGTSHPVGSVQVPTGFQYAAAACRT